MPSETTFGIPHQISAIKMLRGGGGGGGSMIHSESFMQAKNVLIS